MAKVIKIVVAGQGAFGIKHLEALQKIEDVQVVSLTGGNQQQTEEVAKKFGIPHWTGDLAESLAQPGVEAAILATPTQMHADQAVQCLRAGKHVQVEIPMADTVADAERVLQAQKETGLIAMAGHTRRFNPSHQWIHKRIKAGELKVLQMDVQTYFFRRTNMNALGQAAQLDGSPAVAPRVPHGGPVLLPDRRDRVSGLRGAGPDASRSSGSPWTWASS